MLRRAFLSIPLACAVRLFGARAEYLSIKQKFDGIEKHQFRPGSRVPIKANELNAYVQTELPNVAPPGVRSPTVELHGNNMATGRAVINFLTLRNAQGKPSNWLTKKLLEGEREVAVTAEIRSGNGQATVYPRRVEISGVPIEGSALDFLIENYLLPNYPDAKVARPFDLNYGIDRIEVLRDRADVVMQAGAPAR